MVFTLGISSNLENIYRRMYIESMQTLYHFTSGLSICGCWYTGEGAEGS